MTIETLRQLHNIIGESLKTIESTFSDAQLKYPSLDENYLADSPERGLTFTPEIVEATNLIVSSAEQLIANVKLPHLALCDAVMAYHLPACLAFVERVHIAEMVEEAGHQGMHVEQIAKKADVDPLKLEHVLRLLATHYFFREITPNVFGNNKLSSLISSGKHYADILASPKHKYRGTSGTAAFVGLAGDEMFKASSYLSDTLLDSRVSQSRLACDSAFTRAFRTTKSYFEWLGQAENRAHMSRFGSAIMGISSFEHPEAVNTAYNWEALPQGSRVIDVGGGQGYACLYLAKTYPQLDFVIQDLPGILATAGEVWLMNAPAIWQSGRVELQEHNFFEEQPVKDASIFLLRAVCHDWPDDDVLRILVHLRQAAQSGTVLIIGDHILPYACRDGNNESELPGAGKKLPPLPLLANLGKANATAYYMDLTMQTMFNAHERSLQSIMDLSQKAGWNAVAVSINGVSSFGYVIASPR